MVHTIKTQIVALTSFKGGVGKTTSTIHFASYLARKGFKTLILDLDTQANTTLSMLGPDIVFGENPEHIGQLLLKNKTFEDCVKTVSLKPSGEFPGGDVDIVTSNLDLINSANLLTSIPMGAARLQQLVQSDSINGVYDFVFIDPPPSPSVLLYNALYAINIAVIPVAPGKYCTAGVPQLLDMREYLTTNFDFAFLPTMQRKTIASTQVVTDLMDFEPDLVLPSIPNRVEAMYAVDNQVDTFEYKADGDVAQAYKAASEKLLQMMGMVTV